jgi:hypothetical protein
MTDAPEPATAETRTGASSAVIQLPDLSQPEKKQPKRQRPHVRQTRYSDEELAEFEARARAAGLSDGAYTRVSTIGSAGPRARRAPPTKDSQMRAQEITAINRVGNLVNQGIHALNDIRLTAPAATGRDRLADEIEATRKLLQDAMPVLNAALAAVIGDDREG